MNLFATKSMHFSVYNRMSFPINLIKNLSRMATVKRNRFNRVMVQWTWTLRIHPLLRNACIFVVDCKFFEMKLAFTCSHHEHLLEMKPCPQVPKEITFTALLDLQQIEFCLAAFTQRVCSRVAVDRYSAMFNQKAACSRDQTIRISKSVNCAPNKPKASSFRISIQINRLFVVEIKYIKDRNRDPAVEDICIFEWNEYESQRRDTSNNQCVAELSRHRLFQKLSVHCRIFHKQIRKKILRQNGKLLKQQNDAVIINSAVVILHRMVQWVSEYRDLYEKCCSGCNQMLSYDSDQYGLLLPTLRIRNNDTVDAFHISCIPMTFH